MNKDNISLWPTLKKDPLICYYLERIDELRESAVNLEDECCNLIVWLSDIYEECQPDEFQKISTWYETDPISFLDSEFADYELLFAYPREEKMPVEKKERVATKADMALHDYYEFRIRLLELKTERLRQKYNKICNLGVEFYKKYKPEDYQRVWDEATEILQSQYASSQIQSTNTRSLKIEIKDSRTKLFLRTLPHSIRQTDGSMLPPVS